MPVDNFRSVGDSKIRSEAAQFARERAVQVVRD